MSERVISGDGRRLSSLLCSLDLPVKSNYSKTNIMDNPVAQSYIKSHLQNSTVMKHYHSVAVSNPSKSVEQLQEDIRSTLGNNVLTFNGPDWKFFLNNNAPFWCLLNTSSNNHKIIHSVVKIPDLLANTFCGQMPDSLTMEDLSKLLAANLALCHQAHAATLRYGLKLSEDLLLNFLGSFIMNCSVYPDCISWYINALCSMSQDLSFQNHLAQLVGRMTPHHKTEFLAEVFKHVSTGAVAHKILGQFKLGDHKAVLSNLLLSKSKLGEGKAIANFICFLSNALSQEFYVSLVLLPILKVWADPIVARGNVKSEILHYSKSIVAIVSHLQQDTLIKHKMKVVELIAKGLPNHLSSTDPRSVFLAKFICDFLTQTMKLYEKQLKEISEDVFDPSEPICKEALEGFHGCQKTTPFWMTALNKKVDNKKEDEVANDGRENVEQSELNSDDDEDEDDDDLVPIESNSPPCPNKPVYIRDFLEGLPESKTYDDTKGLFSELPKVVRNQIAFEHPQVGRDLLDSVFCWENDFGCADLDELKRASLCATLETKMDGNVEHFCSFFNRETLQAHKKNLIFDVLARVSDNVSLKDLGTLAKVAFRDILRDPNAIQRQDVINKIPMIMFFQKLLCHLPPEMVTEGMVLLYLQAISCIKDPDSGIKQTVQYALYKVIHTLEGKPLSQDIRQHVVETRHWWGQLDN